MTARQILAVIVLLARQSSCALPIDLHEGLFMPLADCSNVTNAVATVHMEHMNVVIGSLRPMTPCHFLHPLLREGTNICKSINVDYELVIENRSRYLYLAGVQSLASGYDSLELDFLTLNGNIVVVKKKLPPYISNRPVTNIIQPNVQWRSPVSLDVRLWDIPRGFATNTITFFRPRFAFGSYVVEGMYHRTLRELSSTSKKVRDFKDREGELIGPWQLFSPTQTCWRAWMDYDKR
jgi:hypothetical protein